MEEYQKHLDYILDHLVEIRRGLFEDSLRTRAAYYLGLLMKYIDQEIQRDDEEDGNSPTSPTVQQRSSEAKKESVCPYCKH